MIKVAQICAEQAKSPKKSSQPQEQIASCYRGTSAKVGLEKRLKTLWLLLCIPFCIPREKTGVQICPNQTNLTVAIETQVYLSPSSST